MLHLHGEMDSWAHGLPPGTDKTRTHSEAATDRRGVRMGIGRELMRGAGPVAVMGLLEQREMYGYELVDALSKETDGVLAMGQSTLYPLLYNLERKGLIRGVWRNASSGRRRRYYRLTAKGKKRLQAQQEQWQELIGAMTNLGIVGTDPGNR